MDQEADTAPQQTMKFTERKLLDLLGRRYNVRPGNGRRYVYATMVRTAAGFDATNTIDAVAMDLWPSQGLTLHAFEVKCSRGDWLNEIKDRVVKKGYTIGPYGTMPETVVPPIIRRAFEKSAPARDLCDTFTIVAAPGIVNLEELPDGWGLLEASANAHHLTARRNAKPKQWKKADGPRPAVQRTFVAALLRAACQETTRQGILEASEPTAGA